MLPWQPFKPRPHGIHAVSTLYITKYNCSCLICTMYKFTPGSHPNSTPLVTRDADQIILRGVSKVSRTVSSANP